MTEPSMRHRLMRIIDTMRDEHESGCIVDALLAELERPSEAVQNIILSWSAEDDPKGMILDVVSAIREGA